MTTTIKATNAQASSANTESRRSQWASKRTKNFMCKGFDEFSNLSV
jgi:hypothetical protein